MGLAILGKYAIRMSSWLHASRSSAQLSLRTFWPFWGCQQHYHCLTNRLDYVSLTIGCGKILTLTLLRNSNQSACASGPQPALLPTIELRHTVVVPYHCIRGRHGPASDGTFRSHDGWLLNTQNARWRPLVCPRPVQHVHVCMTIISASCTLLPSTSNRMPQAPAPLQGPQEVSPTAARGRSMHTLPHLCQQAVAAACGWQWHKLQRLWHPL